MRFLHLLLILVISYVSAGPNDRYLVTPNLEKCKNRFKEFQFNGRNYFYSGHDPELKDQKTDWLDSRNACRERCMETVSFETQEEFDFIKKYIDENKIKFIWTSGRLCDFAGCEGRWDLLPKIIKGWLWSANQKQLDDTDKIPKGWDYTPWSRNGTLKRKQPDNAEFYINQATESCLGVLNNQYNDSISWHDIACYHKTGFICEDSPELLSEAQEVKSQSENREEIVQVAPQKIITEPRPTTTSAPRSTRVLDTTTSAPRTTRLPETTSTRTTTERKTSPVTTTVKTTTEREIIITSSQAVSREEITTEATIPAIETTKGPKFGVRRTRTRTTPSTLATTEEEITTSTTTEAAKIFKEIIKEPRKLVQSTEEDILDKTEKEIPVAEIKTQEEPEIVKSDEKLEKVENEPKIKIDEETAKVEDEPIKVEEKPVQIESDKKEEELQVTDAPIAEEITTIESVSTTEEPKLSIKKMFLKRKKIFGKNKPAVTDEPESVSSAPGQLSRVSDLKKNFRKIKPRPVVTAEVPESSSSAPEEASSVFSAPVSELKSNFRRIKPRPIAFNKNIESSSSAPEELAPVAKVNSNFRKIVPRPVQKTETSSVPEQISQDVAATAELSPEPEVKTNFRKIKPRPILFKKAPEISSSENPAPIATSAPIARKSLLRLGTRTTTAVPETAPSSEDLPEPIRPKKIFGKLQPRTSTTEEPETTFSSTTEQLIEETSEVSTESIVIPINDDLVELQKIDEIIETTTVTTEEPELEERRAIPIKRKQVKLYRKAYKTTTEAYDGPAQSIENNDETTELSPTPIRRKIFKKKFRPRKINE